jgi:hypothetical protein
MPEFFEEQVEEVKEVIEVRREEEIIPTPLGPEVIEEVSEVKEEVIDIRENIVEIE